MNATKIRKKRNSFSSVSLRSVTYNSGHTAIKVALAWEKGGGGGVMINYANYFGGSTLFLHLEWGGSPQNW